MTRYGREARPTPCAVVVWHVVGFAELRRLVAEVEASRAERRGWRAVRRRAFVSPWAGRSRRRDGRCEVSARDPALGTCVVADGPPRRGSLAGVGGVLVS
jgi:hypothetical protein